MEDVMSKWIIGALLALVTAVPAAAQSIQLKASMTDAANPSVQGATNLPDGTKLAIDLVCPLQFCSENYWGESDAIVHDGRFSTEPFSENGAPLKPGRYVISTVVINDQSQGVAFKLLDLGWSRTSVSAFHDTVDFGRQP
jgi:hypothetical protein